MNMFHASAAVLLIGAGILGAGAAIAQPVPASPGVRPRGEPAAQSSVPSPAPPAGTTQATGSTSQDPGVKEMNRSEKAKVDAQGK